jgi:DNA-binding transcriptional ArsR family regulator
VSNILDAIMPERRQEVLSLTLLHPERWWYVRDLAAHIGASPSHAHKELHALLDAGLLESRREGKQLYFRANQKSPIYEELRGILKKTAGLSGVIEEGLGPIRKKLKVVFIYGSIASHQETSESDIDLFIIGDTDLEELSKHLKDAENYLLRPINPTVFTAPEVKKRLKKKDHFLTSLKEEEKLFIIGSDDDLG